MMDGHETVPELTAEEFAIKREALMAEIEILVAKYGIHSMVFAFCVGSGATPKGATGLLGCAGCCLSTMEMMVSAQDRIRSHVGNAMKPHPVH